MESLGCGWNFLIDLRRSMSANGVIGTENIGITSGVEQGGIASIEPFTSCIDPTIDAVNALRPDDWLESTRILLLVDDTVIIATSKEKNAP